MTASLPPAKRWPRHSSSRSPSTKRSRRCTSGRPVRKHLPNGDELADHAIGQEQEGKEILTKLDKLEADNPEFERADRRVHQGRTGPHRVRRNKSVAGPAVRRV